MLRHLIPNEIVDSIYDICLDKLKSRGISHLLIDLDNTLTLWNSFEITPKLENWISNAKSMGFTVCILSNNGEKRVAPYAQSLNIQSIWNAGKPRKKAYYGAIKRLNCEIGNCAVIGDQIFTDVMGGNRSGLYTILVTPISKKEFIGTRLMRCIESIVLKRIYKTR